MADYACRVCGVARLHKVLDLGSMPSANNLVEKEEIGRVRSYPLNYYWCEDCTFFQQVELIKKEDLFGGVYAYRTGVSQPSVDHFKKLAKEMGSKIKNRKFAVVIASNDGTEIELLSKFGKFKKVIGVDPTDLAKIANEKGFFTINKFFDRKLGIRISKKFGGADLVVANNVFAHVPNPRDFLLGMKETINNDGEILIEVHWLKSLVDELQIDTLYGEHYYVWSLRALLRIAEDCGLKISEARYLKKQHGGSIRVILRKSGRKSSDIKKLLDQEREAGLYDIEGMGRLQHKANERREKFINLIRELKGQGKRISVWTVPAKIATFLNFCGLSGSEIECAYDLTPEKIGKFIPKVNIQIKDEKQIGEDMPDYLIVGAWNYIEFGKKKLAWYLKRHGRMINPLTCEIIEGR